MKIFNTLTRTKQELKTIEPGVLKVYACGPTVYNFIHIGNARPLCVFDVLRRYMEYRGYDVKFVQNFTDIDDKIIRRANEEGLTYKEVSEKYIEEFWKDAKGMNVREATVHPKATENIDEIINIISTLIEKGYAYAVDGDVYFSPKKFDEYGKLSHQPLEELEAGARINVEEIKHEPMDFALWKGAKPGEPYWESPWGHGRPGWHIECSAMACKYLGKTIDIHCGGVDLIFPHHENEIAQSEAANGTQFANYWLHNGHINVDNRKMSKSLGNFFTVREAADVYGYETIRFFMLSSHYRSPINYSASVLEAAKAGLERLYTAKNNLSFELKKGGKAAGEEDFSVFEAFKTKFCERMDDDLNTADAVAVLFDFAKQINITIETPHSVAFLQKVQSLFDELCGVLGLLTGTQETEIPADIAALVEKRQQARQNKDYALADELREQLLSLGAVVEDTRDGPKVWMKK